MPSKIPIKFIYHYIGSAVLFMTVIFLLMYLGNVKIPPENKDIFVAITGSLSASLAMVISVLIGKSPEEVEELKRDELVYYTYRDLKERGLVVKSDKKGLRLYDRNTSTKSAASAIVYSYYFQDKIGSNELSIIQNTPDGPSNYNLGDTEEGGEMSEEFED